MKRIFGILAAAIMMSALATSCDNGGLGNGEKLPFIPDEDEVLFPELKPELMDNIAMPSCSALYSSIACWTLFQ